MDKIEIRFPSHIKLPEGYRVVWDELWERYYWELDENISGDICVSRWQARAGALAHSKALKNEV